MITSISLHINNTIYTEFRWQVDDGNRLHLRGRGMLHQTKTKRKRTNLLLVPVANPTILEQPAPLSPSPTHPAFS
jgi:hypothetical protein